jgi:hypothetical protein
MLFIKKTKIRQSIFPYIVQDYNTFNRILKMKISSMSYSSACLLVYNLLYHIKLEHI